MGTERNRIRDLSSQELVERAVGLLLDHMLDPDAGRTYELAAWRLWRELNRRSRLKVDHGKRCVCSDCLGDLFQGEPGPDPFGD